MNSNGISIPNLREYFAERGRKTGLVTTCDVTDATPAAFGAHTLSRTNNADIAAQYIDRNIDIIMGGGSSRFPLGEGGLRNVATQQGYSVITVKSQLMETTATKILALFSGSHLPYEADRNKTTIPSLEEMTVKSINILKQNSQGFFLMVEGGRIDHAGHLPNSDQTKKQKNIDESL
jgi:alkaline phosphatase